MARVMEVLDRMEVWDLLMAGMEVWVRMGVLAHTVVWDHMVVWVPMVVSVLTEEATVWV